MYARTGLREPRAGNRPRPPRRLQYTLTSIAVGVPQVAGTPETCARLARAKKRDDPPRSAQRPTEEENHRLAFPSAGCHRPRLRGHVFFAVPTQLTMYGKEPRSIGSGQSGSRVPA
jgi:hypothetical protein